MIGRGDKEVVGRLREKKTTTKKNRAKLKCGAGRGRVKGTAASRGDGWL